MWHRFMSIVLRFPLIIFIIHSSSSFIYLHRSAHWMHVHFMIAYADRRTKLSVNSFLIKWILHLWWINRITCYCIPTSWIWVLYEPLFLLSTTQLCTTRNAAWKYHLLVDTRWKHSACKVYRLKKMCGDNVHLSIDCIDRNTLFSHITTRQRMLCMPREHSCNCIHTTFVRSFFIM